MHVFVVFYWFERMKPLPTYPKRWDQNQVVLSRKLFFVCWVNFKVFEKKRFLRRDERPQGMRIKRYEVV